MSDDSICVLTDELLKEVSKDIGVETGDVVVKHIRDASITKIQNGYYFVTGKCNINNKDCQYCPPYKCEFCNVYR